MTDDEQTLYMFKGLISEMPAEDRAKFAAAYDDIKAAVERHGNVGVVAVGMIGAEIAVEVARSERRKE